MLELEEDDIENIWVVNYNFQNEKTWFTKSIYYIQVLVYYTLLGILIWDVLLTIMGIPNLPMVYVWPAALIIIFVDFPSKPWIYQGVYVDE